MSPIKQTHNIHTVKQQAKATNRQITMNTIQCTYIAIQQIAHTNNESKLNKKPNKMLRANALTHSRRIFPSIIHNKTPPGCPLTLDAYLDLFQKASFSAVA